MKLYYWPKTRAFRALWMLEELGVVYELVPIDLRSHEQGSDAFVQVNPMAKLPALDDGSVPFAESGAVLLYLADRCPGRRAIRSHSAGATSRACNAHSRKRSPIIHGSSATASLRPTCCSPAR